jgi:hypothetical protein
MIKKDVFSAIEVPEYLTKTKIEDQERINEFIRSLEKYTIPIFEKAYNVAMQRQATLEGKVWTQ